MLYAAGNLITPALNLVLLPILSRQLTPREFGIYAFTTALSVFLTVAAACSLHEYVLRTYFDRRTDEERRELIGTSFVFVAASAAVVSGCALVLLPLLFDVAGVAVPFSPFVQLAIAINGLELLALVPLAQFRAQQRPVAYITLSGAQTLLNGALTVTLVLAGHGLRGRYAGQLIADVAMVPVYLYLVRHAVRTFRASVLVDGLRFSLPLAPAGFFAAANNVADRLLLERYVTLRELGLYSFGYSVGFALNAVVNGVYKAVEPEVYRSAGAAEHDPSMRRLRADLAWGMAGLALLGVAFAREAVSIVAGPSFDESYRVTAIIAVAAAMQGVLIPVSLVPMVARRTTRVALVVIVGGCANVLLNLVLDPLFGMYGAAAASVASAGVLYLGYAVLARRLLDRRWRAAVDLVPPALGALIGASVAGLDLLSVAGLVKVGVVAAGLLLIHHLWRRSIGSAISQVEEQVAIRRPVEEQPPVDGDA